MIAPPPNPHADAARAALREYGSALFKNAPTAPVVNHPDRPDETHLDTLHIADGQAFSTEPSICGDSDMASDGAVLNLNDESIDLLERVLEKHGELTDESKLALARATWPAMRLLDDATIGTGTWWCESCGISHERSGAVVVTVEGMGA